MPKKSQAFTIVELLIVIVIIAVLAAITLVSYNGIQDRAYKARYQATLSQIRTELQTEYITTGKWPFEDGVRAEFAKVSGGCVEGSAYQGYLGCNGAAEQIIDDYFSNELNKAKVGAGYWRTMIGSDIVSGEGTYPMINSNGDLTWVFVGIMQGASNNPDYICIAGSGSPTVNCIKYKGEGFLNELSYR